jgi:UDP-N-acetyl-D-glucosamine dehydrogenase
VLGVAYKAGVADVRDSPALEIIEGLLAKGAVVDYHDPYVASVMIGTQTIKSVQWQAAALASRDVVLILTAHASYDWPTIVRESPLVIDTRNATGPLAPTPHVIRL